MDRSLPHFLQRIGYHPYEISPKDRMFFSLKDPEFVSAYGPVFVEWFPKYLGPSVPILEVNRSRNIIWGLHEADHHPCLIYPRPNILIESVSEEYKITNKYSDTMMDRITAKYSPEEIFRAIRSNLILVL